MIQNTQHLCLECNEAIFNPICPLCLAGEFREWLKDKPEKIRARIMSVIQDYLDVYKNKIGNFPICMSCGKKASFVCPYCFTDLVFNEIKRMKHKKLLGEFFDFFNFDFEHAGYSKELYKDWMMR